MDRLLRVYLDPFEVGMDGYPYAWHHPTVMRKGGPTAAAGLRLPDEEPVYWPIKVSVREQAGNRCVRCGHPYEKGTGEWSPCDERCTHSGPVQTVAPDGIPSTLPLLAAEDYANGWMQQAQWRILTVHHLNGVKHDCRWWNLVALCQRCHLSIQTRVVLHHAYHFEHSEWFKPYAAGWYAYAYLGEDLGREETMARLDELLGLEHRQLEIT